MNEDIVSISQTMARSSPYILYAALFLGLLFFRRLNLLTKSILVYVLLLLVTHYLQKVFFYYVGNTLMVLHIYCIGELAFMIYFYKKFMFKKKQLFLTALGIAGLLYIVSEMLLIFVFKGLVIKEFQPYAKVADNFVIVLMALAYLHEKMSRYGESEWGSFRLNMVFLVFFTLNTIIFLPFNFLINAAGNVKFYFWTGHIILLILFYLYLAFEIWSNGRRTTPAAL